MVSTTSLHAKGFRVANGVVSNTPVFFFFGSFSLWSTEALDVFLMAVLVRLERVSGPSRPLGFDTHVLFRRLSCGNGLGYRSLCCCCCCGCCCKPQENKRDSNSK